MKAASHGAAFALINLSVQVDSFYLRIALFEYCSFICRRYEFSISSQISSLYFWFRGLPCGAAAGEFFVAYIKVDLVVVDVQSDFITFLNKGDRTPYRSFRRTVTKRSAASCARESTIGNQRYLLVQSLSGKSGWQNTACETLGQPRASGQK